MKLYKHIIRMATKFAHLEVVFSFYIKIPVISYLKWIFYAAITAHVAI